jgi:hypothetical protein
VPSIRLGAAVLLGWALRGLQAASEITFMSCDTSAYYLDISSLMCVSCSSDTDGTGNNRYKVSPMTAHAWETHN